MKRICIPVFDCKMLKEAAEKTDLVEVRLDRFGKREREKLAEIAKKIKAKLILTIRKKSEGGIERTGVRERFDSQESNCPKRSKGRKFKGNERQRLALFLEMLKAARFAYADIELSSGRKFIEKVRKKAKEAGAKLILSKHYFAGTPSRKEFLQTYAKMKKLGADICKIVGTARSERDCGNAMEALKKAKKDTAIFFCMGKKGKNTRSECLKFGAPFTYASLKKGKESAKGQYDFGKMTKLLEG